jgi:hypothetical protein
MRTENRRICLLVDNFAGHDIAYEPTNIQLEFFEPNLTPFVQPLDAGIIRCFKAHYRQAFCKRALDLDELGERDIYKINLLEGILMARDAWDAITPETITNCWDHTGIQRAPLSKIIIPRCANPTYPANPITTSPTSQDMSRGWQIVEEFATTDMSLPEAEKQLHVYFGDAYDDMKWHHVLDAVMAAEDDSAKALDAITQIRHTSVPHTPSPATNSFVARLASTSQCETLENMLMESVKELKHRNRIFGEPFTIDELVDSVAELEIGESSHSFEGSEEDVVTQVVDKVCYEEGVKNGEIVEIDSDSDDEEEEEEISTAEIIQMCKKLEQVSLGTAAENAYHVSQGLRAFRMQLQRIQNANAKQVTLETFWKKP